MVLLITYGFVFIADDRCFIAFSITQLVPAIFMLLTSAGFGCVRSKGLI